MDMKKVVLKQFSIVLKIAFCHLAVQHRCLFTLLNCLQFYFILLYFISLYFTFILFYFSRFRAAPPAYGDSQARGQSELQLSAYTTAIAMPDPRCICNLHHSSWQLWIFNLLIEARDRTWDLMVSVRFVSSEPWRECHTI